MDWCSCGLILIMESQKNKVNGPLSITRTSVVPRRHLVLVGLLDEVHHCYFPLMLKVWTKYWESCVKSSWLYRKKCDQQQTNSYFINIDCNRVSEVLSLSQIFHVSNLGLNIIEIKTTFTTKLYLKQNILSLSLGDPAVEVTRNHDINAGIYHR